MRAFPKLENDQARVEVLRRPFASCARENICALCLPATSWADMRKWFSLNGSSGLIEMGIFGALFWLWGQMHSPGWPTVPSLLAGGISAFFLFLVRSGGRPKFPFNVRRQAVAAAVDVPVAAALETSRAFLPGYAAKVDGKPVPVERSPENQVMVRLEPGRHRVDLVYRGSLGLWLALITTGLAWVGLIIASVRPYGPKVSLE